TMIVMAWISFFVNWWLTLAISGALIGCVLGLVIGATWDPADLGLWKTTAYGIEYGATYFGKIWGIGITIVLTVVKVRCLHLRDQNILEGGHWPRF
ncbi:MAG: hypothetical protein AAF212_13345, partial [Verrucomicrobiota bacterium]